MGLEEQFNVRTLSKEVSFWLLILLMISGLIGLGYVANADETYNNGDVFALVHESRKPVFFSTNEKSHGHIPGFINRGLIQCKDGMETETLASGAIVSTCIEIPPTIAKEKTWR